MCVNPGAFGADFIDEMSRTVLLGKQVRQNPYPSHSHSGEKQTSHLVNLQQPRTSKLNIISVLPWTLAHRQKQGGTEGRGRKLTWVKPEQVGEGGMEGCSTVRYVRYM